MRDGLPTWACRPRWAREKSQAACFGAHAGSREAAGMSVDAQRVCTVHSRTRRALLLAFWDDAWARYKYPACWTRTMQGKKHCLEWERPHSAGSEARRECVDQS